MDLRDRLADLAISDSGFVFDPYTGASFTVNATGLAVLRTLKEGRTTRADLVDALRSGFEVRGEDVERDVDEFVGLLHRFELVPRDFQLAGGEAP